MADLVELVDELGRVRLAPIVLPVLKLADPVMGALPEWSLQSTLAGGEIRDSIVKTVESLSPVLIDAIRFLGHVSESRLATGLLSFTAAVLAPPVRLLSPVLAILALLGAGVLLKLAAHSGPVLRPSITALDRITRIELSLEKRLKRFLPERAMPESS
ncbi:MAG: hypothetical protein IBX68_08810 [Dehalococcoidia bacterium]|nr:hypothetical protein [Dehalococcoidia bacterium]